jgi:hypothetical protein
VTNSFNASLVLGSALAFFRGVRSTNSGGDPEMYGRDGAPKLEGIETDFGVRMISRRNGGDGLTYLRLSNFVMPCHGFVPTGGLKGNAEGYTIHSHVPVDDEHAMG